MQVHVKISQDHIRINQVFTANTSEEIVEQCKVRILPDVPFFLRPIVNSMSPLAFAQEVVKRYNYTRGTHLPIPQSCDDFLKTAEAEGLATIS